MLQQESQSLTCIFGKWEPKGRQSEWKSFNGDRGGHRVALIEAGKVKLLAAVGGNKLVRCEASSAVTA